MFKKLRRGGAIAAALALAIVGLVATPALAEDAVKTYDPAAAMLTKVIVAPDKINTSQDEYVFHFAGGGTVTENGDHVYSDEIEQDNVTIKKGDVVPTIPDVTLNGIELKDDNTLSNGQVYQAVVQKSIMSILTDNDVTFPHAGVYTYKVTEKSATTKLADGTYINASQAEYVLRIRVENTKIKESSELGNTDLTVAEVTVEQTKDDDGHDKSPTEKVDPTYPKTNDKGKITYTADGVMPGENTLASADKRGREVAGFTFANEYIKGGSFQVKKLYDGEHSDRTKYSFVELTVYSAAAANPNAHGCVLTYTIEGDGIDATEGNQDSDGERQKLSGVYDYSTTLPQVNHYMAKFNDKGWCKLKAYLKEGSVIRVTGEFGPYNAEYADENEWHNRRMVLSTNGLLQGQEYYVIESEPGNYIPTGYVYVGTDSLADPRKHAEGITMTATSALTDETTTDPTDPIPDDQPSYTQRELKKGALLVHGSATGSATTVFVVNKINEDNVTPTGIFIDNLPYILMVGVPLVVFAGMFVAKRRESAAA